MATLLITAVRDENGNLVKMKRVPPKLRYKPTYRCESELIPIELTPDKRDNKNLESLIRRINSEGFVVTLSQIYLDGDFKWYAFIQVPSGKHLVVGYADDFATRPYAALKASYCKYVMDKGGLT